MSSTYNYLLLLLTVYDLFLGEDLRFCQVHSSELSVGSIKLNHIFKQESILLIFSLKFLQERQEDRVFLFEISIRYDLER